MAIDRIPTSTTLAYYELEVELDDVQFRLEFRYNDRDSAWYLTIRDAEDTLLRAGIRVVNSWDLLRLWAEDTRPDGQLVTVNQGDVPNPPTLNQLGAEVVLTYLDEDEVAALG